MNVSVSARRVKTPPPPKPQNKDPDHDRYDRPQIMGQPPKARAQPFGFTQGAGRVIFVPAVFFIKFVLRLMLIGIVPGPAGLGIRESARAEVGDCHNDACLPG